MTRILILAALAAAGAYFAAVPADKNIATQEVRCPLEFKCPAICHGGVVHDGSLICEASK